MRADQHDLSGQSLLRRTQAGDTPRGILFQHLRVMDNLAKGRHPAARAGVHRLVKLAQRHGYPHAETSLAGAYDLEHFSPPPAGGYGQAHHVTFSADGAAEGRPQYADIPARKGAPPAPSPA